MSSAKFDGPVIGVIGGSSLLHASGSTSDIASRLLSAPTTEIETSHGRVLYRHIAVLEDNGREAHLVFIQRHQASPCSDYTQPAHINYPAIAFALKTLGCSHVMGMCSVGALKDGFPLGAFVIPDDYYCPADLRPVYNDYRGHFMPSIDANLHGIFTKALVQADLDPHAGGVYVNSKGPRFETKAEIRIMSMAGDIIGMTGAHEASACQEVGIPYAMIGIVDNYANGVSDDFDVEKFKQLQKVNIPRICKMLESVIPAIAHEAIEHFDSNSTNKHEGTFSKNADEIGSPSAKSTNEIETVDLIVHAHHIVPVVPENVCYRDHAIAVREGRIVAILPSSEISQKYSAHRTVRLGHHVLMPGLINAHTHMAMNYMRGLADDKPLLEWLTMDIWPTEGRLVSHSFVAAGTRAAAAECIRGGVTTINDMYFFPGAVAEELYSVGLRASVGLVCLEFPTRWAQNADEYLSKGRELIESWRKRGHGVDRVRFTLAPHAPYTVADPTFERIKKMSEELDVQVHLHLHETEAEICESSQGIEGPARHLSKQLCTPFANLDRLGLINKRMIAVHMTQLSDDEIARAAAAGTSVVHCPSSNLKLASGFAPVWKMTKAGVNVAIGTDSSASNNTLDMFAEMRLAAILAKATSKDATATPAATALRMATLNGAKALGIDNDTGSLEVGKWADMIAVRLDNVEQMPLYNIISHLVYAMDRTRVTDVWVGGRQLLAGRALLSIDEFKLKREIKSWAHKVRLSELTEEADESQS